MIKHIKYETLGSTEFSWLKSKHHFSFGEYRDRERLGHGELIVINDDIISSKTGFMSTLKGLCSETLLNL